MQNFKKELLGYSTPIIIGGVGGSGTRLITQYLKNLGFYMGNDLNYANDNRWFTFLFKRIEILSSSKSEFNELLKILIQGITGSNTFTKEQIKLIKFIKSKQQKRHSDDWLEQRITTLLSEKKAISSEDRWGWKEPNSHLVLDRLVTTLENIKYIHVIRNGLDMAYSQNQNQLKLWGNYILNEDFNITPYFSLKYWCIVHKRVFQISESMGDHFLLLNFDNLCLNPEQELGQLFDFLSLENDLLMPSFISLVKPLNSIGRFKHYKDQIFDKKDLEFVKSLGFDID